MTIRVGVVIGEFHREIAEKMLAHVESKVGEMGAELVKTVWVPGSFEAPMAVKKLLDREDVDCVAVTGYIERGSTLHGEQMGIVVSLLVKNLEQRYDKPVGWGIIGPGATQEEALVRLDYGAHAAEAAIRMCDTIKRI